MNAVNTLNTANTYATLNGGVIEYGTLAPDVAAYLDRVKAAAQDPAVSYSEMIELVHHVDNPVLDRKYILGRGSITAAVLVDPVYKVMADLIGVKQVNLGLIKPEVPRLEGVIGSTEGGSLAVRVRGGSLRRLCEPEGRTFFTLTFSEPVIWESAIVRSTANGSVRAWVIEPGEEDNTISFRDLFVAGRFRVVEKINNAKKANDAWRDAMDFRDN